jgi:protocatechuate 3,4-dioxygenase beta subunit
MKTSLKLQLVLTVLLAAISSIAVAESLTGSISGTVTNGSGDPIVGLEVEVYLAGIEEEDDDEAGLATTDANGNYTVADLPAGDYYVFACSGCTGLRYLNEVYNNHTDYRLADAVTVTAGNTTSPIDFELAQSGAISGTVTDSQGNPIANMTIEAICYDDPEKMDMDAVTDISGQYEITGLEPGDYRVFTRAEETDLSYANKFYNNKSSWDTASRVTITGTETTVNINFVLQAGGAISGTVLNEQGNPIEDLHVYAEAYDGSYWGNGSNTDANGQYTIKGLRSNTYRVRACASCDNREYADQFYDHKTDWDNATQVTVAAPNTTEGVDFTLGAGTYISGYVYGWDANDSNYVALEGAHVCVEYFSGGGGWAGADTDANGYYKVTGLRPSEYRLRVEKSPFIEKYYPDAIDWCEAEALTVTAEAPAIGIDFEMDLGGTITGTVTNEQTGQPITDNGWVNACPTNGEPWGRGCGEIDSNGLYTITGLPEGTYKVEAQFEGYDREFYGDTVDWMMATNVEVAVGETAGDIDFALKPESGGAIVGRVVLPDNTPVPDAQVNADSVENMKWKNAQSDPNGEFRITGITPGQWCIRAQPPFGTDYLDASESPEMLVDINESATETDIGDITLPTVNLIGQALMPDDSPARHVPVNIETLDWSFFQNVGTDEQGYFRVGGLSEGTYRLKLEMPWGTSGVVPPDPCEVEITDTNSILNIGTIKYTTALKHIEGRVKKSNEAGVANAEINGWRRGSEGWAHTMSDANGNFSMDLAPGTWELMIHPSPQASNVDWIYMGNPKVVTFVNDANEETKSVTFTIETAGSQVMGRVTGPNGETVRSGTAWVEIRDDVGRGNGVSVGTGGTFEISVSSGKYNVWVGVDQQTYPRWSSPQLPPFDIDDGETVTLPDIELVEKTSGIHGNVTRSSDGEPVSGVYIHAWRQENGWADTTTDDNGNYQLSVTSGNWEVAAEPPYNSSYVSGQPPQRVIVNDNEIVSNIDFELIEAAGTIDGTLYDSSGNIITDIDGGWAYARRNSEYMHEPIAGSPVENGQFSFNIPDGTYLVGVHLPPNSGYSMAEEQEVTVGSESDTEVDIVLLSNDSTIRGTFYTDSSKTTAATDLEGEVFAMQEKQGVWQNTRINPDGTYELRVAEGNWNLGYWIMSEGYVNNPPPDTRVSVTSGESTTFDFVIIGADATISGVVLDPNGNPIPHAWVWAHSEGDDESKRIDCGSEAMPPEGTFSINVPSGRTYEVGAHCPESWGYIQPDMQRVRPTSGANVEITLQFKQSDATIIGTVSYDPGDGNTAACDQAWVNAWNEDGQHTGGMTDDQGNYQLNVSQGATWYVDAVYHPYGDVNFYEVNEPTEVVMSSSQATADLLLFRASDTIPAATSATFDPNVGWTHTLENGTTIEIPGGAIPTTDTVCISITPLVENMRKTKNEQPLGCGYSISISEETTGNPITENFNTNVLITFTYSDERLAAEGLTEDDISPAYYSSTTNSWTKVESFTIDKENNKVKAQINHFSLWSLTGGGGDEDEETTEVALTISKCVVKAGKTTGEDRIILTGTFDTALENLQDANAIEVELLSASDSYSVYTESIDFDYSDVTRDKYNYKYKVPKGGDGAITNLIVDLNKKTIILKADKVDLTGLSCPLELDITVGSYLLSGEADEDVVNGSRKTIPITLMKTYKDCLNVTKAKVKSGRSGDVFVVQGTIAVEDMNAADLTGQDVVITWGSQSFTVAQGSMTLQSTDKYKCKSSSVTEGGTMLGIIDFNKGIYVIAIKDASLDSKSGMIDFGLSFGNFDETTQYNLD